LVRSHIHAIWLVETGQDLKRSLVDVLDVAGDRPSLEIQHEVWKGLTDREAAARAVARAEAALRDLAPELAPVPWWHEGWIEKQIERAPQEFVRACLRWKDLYRTALAEYESQSRRAVDPTLKQQDRDAATRRARDARIQLNLLRNDEAGGDFQN